MFNPFRCKLIDQENVGSRLMNSSEYDGALGELHLSDNSTEIIRLSIRLITSDIQSCISGKLQRGEADVFMKGEWPILDDEAIGLTPVTNTEE